MKQNLTTLFGALIALTLLAAACGGGSGSDQEVIDAIAGQMQAEFDDDEIDVDIDADCMAKGIVESFGGAEKMAESFGVSVDDLISDESDITEVDLDEPQAVQMADEIMDCGMLDVMAGGFADLLELSGDDAKCLVDSMDRDALRDSMAAEFMSSEAGAEFGRGAEERMESSMFSAFSSCELDLTN